MSNLLRKCEIPFFFFINFLILLFIIYIYIKGCVNYAVYGILIFSISTSLGIIRNDFFKLHEKKIRIIRIVIWSCGLAVCIVGFLNILSK